MERLDYGSPEGNATEKTTRSRGSKKRKWREIEALQERKRLIEELHDIDFCTGLDEEMLEI